MSYLLQFTPVKVEINSTEDPRKINLFRSYIMEPAREREMGEGYVMEWWAGIQMKHHNANTP